MQIKTGLDELAKQNREKKMFYNLWTLHGPLLIYFDHSGGKHGWCTF